MRHQTFLTSFPHSSSTPPPSFFVCFRWSEGSVCYSSAACNQCQFIPYNASSLYVAITFIFTGGKSAFQQVQCSVTSCTSTNSNQTLARAFDAMFLCMVWCLAIITFCSNMYCRAQKWYATCRRRPSKTKLQYRDATGTHHNAILLA